MTAETQSKGEQARAEILAAAKRLFVAQGFHGTSMRAIAREAGDRAVAGIYNHFPTKEAIFEALISEGNPYHELFGVIESAMENAHTVEEFVRSALRVIMRIMPNHYDFILLAQIDMREFEGKNISLALGAEVFPRVFALFDRLQELPDIKPIEVITLMRTMASLMVGYIITAQALPIAMFHELDHEEWADRFASILLYGIAEQPGRKDE